MKVTGFQIKERISYFRTLFTTLVGSFENTIYVFGGITEEDKMAPEKLQIDIEETANKIARLQELQSNYNNTVTVDIPGFGVQSITFMVKIISSLGTIEKILKLQVAPKSARRHFYHDDPTTRAKDQEYAVRVVDEKEMLQRYRVAATRASNVRGALAKANTTQMDVEEDKDLFEIA